MCFRIPSLLVVSLFGLLAPLRAQVHLDWLYYGTNDFNLTSNWTPVSSPAGNNLFFPSFINNNLPNLSASVTVNSLTLSNGSGLYFFGSGRTLGINDGINASAATGFTYFRSGLTLELINSQTWNVGYEIYVEDRVTGEGGILKTGSGALMLGGSGSGSSSYNDFSGGVTVSGGTLRLGGDSSDSAGITGPVGSGTLTMQNGTTLVPYYVASGGSRTLYNSVHIANNVTLGDENVAGGLRFEGQVTITDATAAIHLGDGRLVRINGGLGATNEGTTLTFDGLGTVIIDSTSERGGTSSNISLITASNAAVVFAGANSLPTAIAATNNGYIGMADGFTGGAAEPDPSTVIGRITSPGTFAGTIGFDTDPDVSSEPNEFYGTINLSGFTSTGFRGLGTQTSAILGEDATILNPHNGILQLSGLNDGTFRVETPLLTAHGVNQVIIGRTDGLGTGTVILDANNTYVGGTTLQSGTLLLGDSTALGTGQLVIPVGASFPVLGAIDGDRTVANNIVINHTGLRIGNEDDTCLSLVLSGIISGVGNLDVHWGDSLTLTNANSTFSGGLTVFSGTVFLAGSSTGAPGNITQGPAGKGTITLNDGTALAPTDGNVTLANAINVSGSVSLGQDSEDDLSLTGVISGTGSITSTIPHLTLSGANTFSGGFTLNRGELILAGSSNAGGPFTSGPVGTGTLTLLGGSYLRPADAGTPITLRNDISLVENEDRYVHIDDDDHALSLTLSGLISGGGGIDWCTPGTLTLTNNGSTFEYGVDMRVGTLWIGGSSSASAKEGGGYTVISGPLGTGSLILYGDTVLGVSSGSHTLHNDISLNQSYTTVTFDTTNGNLFLLGEISGSYVQVNKTGNGILSLGGFSGFNGGVTVQAGTLYLGTSSSNYDGLYGPVGSGTLTLKNGTTLGVDPAAGATTLDNEISLDSAASSNVTIDTANGDLTLTNVISGASGITKTALHTLTLGGTNTYAGPTIINGGLVSVSELAGGGFASGIGQSSGDAANLVLNGGALRYTGPTISTDRLFTLGTNGGGFNLTSASTLTFSNTGTVALTGTNTARNLKFAVDSSSGIITFRPVITDNGTGRTSLVKDGAGLLSLNSANTYTGDTWIKGGTLRVFSNSLSNLTSVIVETGAKFTAHDAPLSIGSLSGAGTVQLEGASDGSSVFTVGSNNASTTFSGQLNGDQYISLVKTGTGTLTLNGNNTYGAGTTVTGGMLVAGNANALGSGSITLNGGGLGVASGVVLTNPLIFSGPTTVLGGNGTFGTHITANNSVVISPGNSPGTLTFSAGLTLAGGSAISFQIQDAAGSAGVGYDLIAVTGGVLNLTAPTNTITFNIVSLNSDGNYGAALNFNPSSSYSWTFASSPNAAITGFNAAQFNLVPGEFVNGLNGGQFSVSQALDQRSLLLNFTPVPEPSTWLMLGSGLGALALKLRRRRR